MADIVSALARNHLQDVEALEEHRVKQREDEYVFVFSRETHVQCLSLSAQIFITSNGLFDVRTIAGTKPQLFPPIPLMMSCISPSASRSYSNQLGYMAFLSYMIPGANRQHTAALDRGTNLSFALRYPSNLFRMLLKEAAGKRRRDTCELTVHQQAPRGT